MEEEEEKKMSLAEEALDTSQRLLATEVEWIADLAKRTNHPEYYIWSAELTQHSRKLFAQMEKVIEENEWLKRENDVLKEERSKQAIPAEEKNEEEPAKYDFDQLLKKITPWFGHDETAACDFIRTCEGVKPKIITRRVGELMADGIMLEAHAHKTLWEALHDAGLYPHTIQNWNTQVVNAAEKHNPDWVKCR